MKRFVTHTIIVLIVSGYIFTWSCHDLTKTASVIGALDWSRFALDTIVCGGALGGVVYAIRHLILLCGEKTLFTQCLCFQPLGESSWTINLPHGVSSARIFIFFGSSKQNYNGKISVRSASGVSVASLVLPRIRTWRFQIPRWLPLKEAGELVEIRGKGVGRSLEPAILDVALDQNLGDSQILVIEFALAANFVEPVGDCEMVEIHVREKCGPTSTSSSR